MAKTYYAACSERTPPHVGQEWDGPHRTTMEEAEKDVQEHKKKTGHRDVAVLSY